VCLDGKFLLIFLVFKVLTFCDTFYFLGMNEILFIYKLLIKLH
jgi:hypothetical protein